ncbi:MAG TPA: hypothetical protein V6C69_01350, partial [Trichormus sp.]
AALQETHTEFPAGIDTSIAELYRVNNLPPPKVVVACESPLELHFYSQAFNLESPTADNVAALARTLSQQARTRQDQSVENELIDGFKTLQKQLPHGTGNKLTPEFEQHLKEASTLIQAKINLRSDLALYLRFGLAYEVGSLVARLAAPYSLSNLSIQGGQENITTVDLGRHGVMQIDQAFIIGRMQPTPAMGEHMWCISKAENFIGFALVHEVLQNECPLTAQEGAQLDAWINLIKAAPWYGFFENVCFVGVSPNEIVLDNRLRISNMNGPAIVYADGFKVWSIQGMIAPRNLVESPQDLTLQEIDAEANVALRRMMIEGYGMSRYLLDSEAMLIHSDEFGELYRKELPSDEPLVMVCVINKTPEPDGTYKKYFLRVPPEISTAKEAVAWTFEQQTEEYMPGQET